MMPSAAATSNTLRAIGPPVSKLSARGMMPERLSNPCVGFNAAMPFVVAGPRIERAGLLERPGVEKDHRMQRRPVAVERVDPCQTYPGQRLGRQRAGIEGRVDVGDSRRVDFYRSGSGGTEREERRDGDRDP